MPQAVIQQTIQVHSPFPPMHWKAIRVCALLAIGRSEERRVGKVNQALSMENLKIINLPLALEEVWYIVSLKEQTPIDISTISLPPVELKTFPIWALVFHQTDTAISTIHTLLLKRMVRM